MRPINLTLFFITLSAVVFLFALLAMMHEGRRERELYRQMEAAYRRRVKYTRGLRAYRKLRTP